VSLTIKRNTRSEYLGLLKANSNEPIAHQILLSLSLKSSILSSCPQSSHASAFSLSLSCLPGGAPYGLAAYANIRNTRH
jgi:hypothetical protein